MTQYLLVHPQGIFAQAFSLEMAGPFKDPIDTASQPITTVSAQFIGIPRPIISSRRILVLSACLYEIGEPQ
jgi:hypothetical protein